MARIPTDRTATDRTAASAARHGRLRAGTGPRAVLKLVAVALAVALVSGTSVAAVAAYQLVGRLGATAVDITPEGQAPPSIGAIDGPVNILLVGSDSGEGNPAYGERGENLNDVTMLLHISPDSNSATALSFPRDTIIDHPECTGPDGEEYGEETSRINVALSRGGLPCAVATVNELTGLPIQYAAKIEFDGVIAMSDAVGGVTVCVAEPIDDSEGTGFELEAGQQTLQGFQALQFLRTRYGVADGSDLGRISNQQIFLSALMRKVKSTETLTNPVTLYNLATAAVNNMELSQELASPDTMVSMALALRKIPLERINFIQYPTAYNEDFSGVTPREADAEEIVNAIAEDRAVVAGGTGDGVGGADGTVPTPEPSPSEDPSPEASADPSASPSPSISGSPDDPVQLPDDVTGQSAADETCSNAG